VKALVVFMMKGRLQAVASASVLAILALILTPLGIASSAVIALATLRQGWKEGLLVTAFGTLVMAVLGHLWLQQPLSLVLVALMLWLPMWLLGSVLGVTNSLRQTLQVAAILAVLLIGVQYLYMADPVAFWADLLGQFVAQAMDPEVIAEAEQQKFALMAAWMPGGVAAVWFLGNALALMLARYSAALLDSPGSFGKEFRQLRFDRWLLIMVPLLLAGVLLNDGEPGFVGQLYLIGMLVFLLQGISLVHDLVAQSKASQGWLIGLYFVLVVGEPHSATAIAAVGYADGWLDFRAKARARSSK